MFSVSRSRISYATDYVEASSLNVKEKKRPSTIGLEAAKNAAAIFEEEYQQIRRLQELDNTEIPGMEGLTFSELRLKTQTRAFDDKDLELETPAVSVSKKVETKKAPEQRASRRSSVAIEKEKRRKSHVEAELQRITKEFVFLKAEDYNEERAKRAFYYPGYIDEGDVSELKESLSVTQSTTSLYEKWRAKRAKQTAIHFTESERSSPASSGDSSAEGYTVAIREKSVYDLPIEFHMKTLIHAASVKSMDTMRTQISMSSTLSAAARRWKKLQASLPSLTEGEAQRKSRFMNLKPELLIRALATRRCFTDVRPLALRKLQENIESKIDMMGNLHVCQLDKFVLEDLPYQVFSWSEADFTDRRQLNPIWIDIMRKAVAPSCLQKLKFVKDISEFKLYLGLFFKAFLNVDEDPDIHKHVVEIIEACFDFLKLFELLRAELEEHTETLRRDVQRLTNAAVFQLDSSQTHKRAYYIRQLEKRAAIAPIEFRCIRSCYRSQCEDAEFDIQKRQRTVEDEIGHYEGLLDSEIRRSNSTLNTYYIQMQEYQSRSNEMALEIEQQTDYLDQALFRKRTGIERMQMSKAFCMENLEYLKSEVDYIRTEEQKSSFRGAKRRRKPTPPSFSIRAIKRRAGLSEEVSKVLLGP